MAVSSPDEKGRRLDNGPATQLCKNTSATKTSTGKINNGKERKFFMKICDVMWCGERQMSGSQTADSVEEYVLTYGT